MEKKKQISIKSLSMLNYLIRQGFDCVGADDNEHCKHFKVFFFDDTPELRKTMEGFSKSN